MINDVSKKEAQAALARIEKSISTGNGCSYELYIRRFSAGVDALLASNALPGNLTKDEFIEIAYVRGYATQEEIIQGDRDTCSCSHGFDPDCCPCGCGDFDT